MASLYRSGETFCIRFRFAGRAFKRSLKTTRLQDAEGGKAIVELTLYKLHTGQLTLPADVDTADFIVSGGILPRPASVQAARQLVPDLRSLVESYLAHIEHHAAPTYVSSQQTHLRHFLRFLGRRADGPIDRITADDIQDFLDRQLSYLDPNTVNKQRITLVQFYKWVVKRKLLARSPMTDIADIKFGLDRPPFRTLQEVQGIIERGGLSREEELELWECLYLDPSEIAALLTLVRERAAFDTGPLLHLFPAYTGMRRGEVLRLRWIDVDLENDSLTARSRKQSRSMREVTRRIDIHPELKVILQTWRAAHPRGQYVLFHEQRGTPLNAGQADHRFWQPMRGTQWCLDSRKNWYKIGFHTYRHSFASNLAAAGVDQRIIDEFMGHTTEAMRKRYRHLFPSRKKEAIQCLSFLG
jgi:integrase